MDPEPVSTIAPPLRGVRIMNQDWLDLSMLHWAVDPERVAHLFPRGVRPDTHDGATYVGLVPFRMVDAGVGRRSTVPYAGTFLETNVRLYSVDETGRRGVVFLSLDCNRLVVVAGARLGFGVPYRWARMSYAALDGTHDYRARLVRPGAPVRSRIVVRDLGPKSPDALDEFVSARWGLHTSWLGRSLYVPNEHPPWPLHAAEMVEFDDGLLGSVGLGELARRPPDRVAFSPGVHTDFGLPTRASRPRVL